MGDTNQTTQDQTATTSNYHPPILINNSKSDKTTKHNNKKHRSPKKSKPEPNNNASPSSSIRHFKHRTQSRLTSEDGNTETPVNPPKEHHKKKTHTLKGDDLSSVLAHGLKSSSYECMICMDIVRPAHPIWTCDCCWAVFHLNCVNQWASKSLKDTSSQKLITQWRCPGCQHTRTAIPRDYFCFCGKQRNPEKTSRYATPHSCEQLCKRHKSCPHPCVLPCHPGPCPPCSLMGPKQTCFCGDTTRQSRCTDTDYKNKGYSCEKPCGLALGCGKHHCESKCHKGLCAPCPLEEVQTCYCGRHERTARCGSGKKIQLRGHVGYYSCDEKRCDSVYQCGVHACLKQMCHPCESNDKACPLDPENVVTCPCGSRSVRELLGGAQRSRCTDEIPTCESKCDKVLSCGLHTCPKTCHTGDCPPCRESVLVPCRCLSSKFKDSCAYVSLAAGGEPPSCKRVCKSLRNCGHHVCGEICCPAAKVNGKRRPGTEHVHDCPEMCNKLLSCGNHRCQAKCHKGKCQPCLEATFEELSCHCGRTQLEPPIRCGTKIPECNYPCIRPNPCGHVRFLQHNCHPDEEACPPCPVLVTRTCLCGKTELKNVPCYRDSPRCGQPCGKPLACGRHVCPKTCHDGPCLSSSSSSSGEEEVCEQVCGSTRECGHPCQDKCHGDINTSSCPEDTPCTARIRATCPCGQNTMEIPCHATCESSGSNQELECNDFCAKVLRNKRLALALDINRDDVASSSDLVLPNAGYYDASLCEFYLENPAWCRHMEDTLIRFVQDKDTRTFYFKPMRSQFRRFLHRYAIHFNIKTEAVDPEPHRSVVMRKTIGDCRMPPLLLSKTARNPTLNKSLLAEQQLQLRVNSALPKHPINALYLSDVMPGMTKLELDAALAPVLKLGEDNIPFVTTWTGAEEGDRDTQNGDDAAIVTPLISDRVSMDEKELIIWQLKRLIKLAFEEGDRPIIGRVDCCWISQKGKLLWVENKKKKLQEQQQQQQQQVNNNKFDTLKDSDSESDDNNDGWMQVGKTNPYKPVVVATTPSAISHDLDDAWKEPPLVKKNVIFEQQQADKEIPKDRDTSIQNAITADDWEDLA